LEAELAGALARPEFIDADDDGEADADGSALVDVPALSHVTDGTLTFTDDAARTVTRFRLDDDR
jgi:hypothetical protein